MNSNKEILQNLRKLKSFGVEYIDPISFHKPQNNTIELPDNIININKNIQECHLCEFSKSRNKIAIDNNTTAKIFFVDFRANIVENDTGIIFSGKAGEMLDKMTTNVLKVDKKDIFVSNLVKCYSNKTSILDEAEICKEYTLKQIKILKPKVLVLFSYESYQILTSDFSTPFENLKGKVLNILGCKTIVTNSPKTLLRNPSLKKETLSHLNIIKEHL